MGKQIDPQKFPWRAVAGGVLAMFLAFGVGRFAYTPLLPLMQTQAGLAVDMAGYLASLMYLGYLSGSLAVTKILPRFSAIRILRLGLIALVLGSLAMAGGDSFWHWALVMFCIGFASAAIFLSTLSLVLGIFIDYGASWLTAFIYTGIGSAIVFIGFAVPVVDNAAGWQGAWTFVAFTALVGGFCCHALLSPTPRDQQRSSGGEPAWPVPGAQRAARLLISAYFLHGFAYTIGGTFMVTILSEVPGLKGHAHLGWIMVGATVIPACIIWPLFAARRGQLKTIALLLIMLAGSNLMVILWQTTLGVIVAAAIFGGSFLTIPGLVLGQLGELAGRKKDELVGFATIIFGISMVLGP